MDVSVTWVLSFLAVVEHGSVTEAARVRCYAQSTVTAHIQALEHRLGCALFVRESVPWRLTEEGQRSLKCCIRLQAAVRDLSRLAQTPSPLHRRPGIGVSDGAFLGDALSTTPGLVRRSRRKEKS